MKTELDAQSKQRAEAESKLRSEAVKVASDLQTIFTEGQKLIADKKSFEETKAKEVKEQKARDEQQKKEKDDNIKTVQKLESLLAEKHKIEE